ncbi:putative serine carboxypeptidase [Dissoconium aciculare CBS 342.82]|uniref:Carboxypeptidase n=1 Tax=Dissoconium aciculare CBS 342.82 TaxID=1314786 RepID=A0A6J3LPU7_9PEZI|nr:putative serine carboxypeptidase [Dissoconium aciculare CBS 342.82]KAF1817890.1 putative serine carboxypeptidase [Dissoconium aciculare CBS 342.82]
MWSTLLPFVSLLPAAVYSAPLVCTPSDDGFEQGVGYGDVGLRYREVPPGICELDPDVKSYSGYADISEHEHIFFWFFEARNVPPETAPLTAYISGGPGYSSMSELFAENGPCRIGPDGKTLHNNPFSWSNYSNLIFIDQPNHVGFSYSDLVPGYMGTDKDGGNVVIEDDSCEDDDPKCGCFSKPDVTTTANSTLAAAPKFWLTLQAFMSSFPEYSENGFHLASESYGGHYAPVFSKYIQDQNEACIPGARYIDLQSMLVGNGWYSPQIQRKAYYDYGYEPGSPYDLPPINSTFKKEVYEKLFGPEGCLKQLRDCEATGTDKVCKAADNYCAAEIDNAWTEATGRDTENVRMLNDSPFSLPHDFYETYLELDYVREAIGALQTFTVESPTVVQAFDLTGDDGRELGILHILGELAEAGVNVVLYNGDADYNCNYLGVGASAAAVGFPGYDNAGHAKILTDDCVTHASVKQSGPFSFVRLYEAGHTTASYQPLAVLTIFRRAILGLDLATGTTVATSDYISPGPLQDTYREGNGTVQYKSWPHQSTYNYTSNMPTLDDFEPTWNGGACARAEELGPIVNY